MSAIHLAVSANLSLEVVSIDNFNKSHTATDPDNAYTGVQYQRDGDIVEMAGNAETYSDLGKAWITPQGAASGDNYEIFCTLNSSGGNGLDGNSDATGSWLALTSDRKWQCSRLIVGTDTANITIQIRKVGGSVLDSATHVLTSTVEV